MAFRPEPMQRTVIIAARAEERAVIETLHSLHAAHLVDFAETREGAMAEFRIGRPLPEGSGASEKLVRLRAAIRQLGLEGQDAKRSFEVRDLERSLATAVGTIEGEIAQAAESKANLGHEIDRLRDEETRLAAVASLPLAIEDYQGYETLTVFVGTTATPVADEIRRVAPEALVFTGAPEAPIAVFAPKSRAEAVNDILFKNGYREHQVPAGTGAVEARLAAIASERGALEGRLASAEGDLARLREKHGDFLIAAEEHLTIEVAKAEAPLSFATTENAVVIDAWIPSSQVKRVEAALINATRGNVHVERVKREAHAMHGMDAMTDAHGSEPGEGHGDAHAEEDHPPVMLANPGPTKPFQFFTEMFSTPKYDEIDPTIILSIAFPLFFGFMIGDLGLGLVMAVLGFFMARKLAHVEGLRELGVAIGVAGVIAAVFGGFVFQDAFGMPLGFTHHAVTELGDKGLPVACTPAVYNALGETNWGCLLGANVWHLDPIIGKTTDIPTMLVISLGAAFVHLGLGLLFGIRNEWGHGAKHVAAKFGWLILLVTFFPAVLALLDSLPSFITKTQAFAGAGVGAALGVVILGWAEGIVGILEMPSMLSNILSYLRLGAVAIAKGSMAVAFNNLTLVSIGLQGKGLVFILLGLVAFVIVQMLLFVLGLLSSGIQAIRLNYVEFFTKFYKGGGEKFRPFGHARRFTSSANSPTIGGGKL